MSKSVAALHVVKLRRVGSVTSTRKFVSPDAVPTYDPWLKLSSSSDAPHGKNSYEHMAGLGAGVGTGVGTGVGSRVG